MLRNVVLTMRAPEHLGHPTGPAALTSCAFGDKGISATSGAAPAAG